MALTIKEFKINELRAKIGKPLHGMKIANFYYGDDFRKAPIIRAYGGMRVVKGKFGNYFELDLKDDDLSLAGSYLNEKSWNLKSPIVKYGIFYSIRCKIPKNFESRRVLSRLL